MRDEQPGSYVIPIILACAGIFFTGLCCFFASFGIAALGGTQ